MYKEEIHFQNCNLNGFGRFWPSDPEIYRVPLLPWTGVWTKFEEGRSRLSWVIGWKPFWHIWPRCPWPLTHTINRVPLLPRTYVWTMFEEGRSRRSQVIDLKRKGYRRTDRQTDRLTWAKQYALSSSKGGITNCDLLSVVFFLDGGMNTIQIYIGKIRNTLDKIWKWRNVMVEWFARHSRNECIACQSVSSYPVKFKHRVIEQQQLFLFTWSSWTQEYVSKKSGFHHFIYMFT